MQKKVVRHINEQTIQRIVSESVKKFINEMDMNGSEQMQEEDEIGGDMNEEDTDEGFFNNLKTGAKTFFSDKNKGQGLRTRFDRAKQNFNNQAEYDNTNELLNKIKQFIQLYNQKQDEKVARNGWDKRSASTFKIKNSTTVGELLGYTNRGGQRKMGKMTQGALNTKKDIDKLMQ